MDATGRKKAPDDECQRGRTVALAMCGSQRPTWFDVGVEGGGGEAGEEFALGQDGDHGGVVGGVLGFGEAQEQSFAPAFAGHLPAQGAVAGHAAKSSGRHSAARMRIQGVASRRWLA